MFTGIVQAVGTIATVAQQADGLRIELSSGGFFDDVAIGDSIAVNGCCLTAVRCDRASSRATFDVSGETLRCTSGFAAGAAVNLEKALRLSDRLGGHLVTGHIDATAVVREFTAVDRRAPDRSSFRLIVEAPHELARYIAAKGSIAVHGVSLTVNRVDGDAFEVNLIPHTLEATTLRHLVPGARVNLEVDLMARYAERLRGDAQ